MIVVVTGNGSPLAVPFMAYSCVTRIEENREADYIVLSIALPDGRLNEARINRRTVASVTAYQDWT